MLFINNRKCSGEQWGRMTPYRYLFYSSLSSPPILHWSTHYPLITPTLQQLHPSAIPPFRHSTLTPPNLRTLNTFSTPISHTTTILPNHRSTLPPLHPTLPLPFNHTTTIPSYHKKSRWYSSRNTDQINRVYSRFQFTLACMVNNSLSRFNNLVWDSTTLTESVFH